MATFPFAYVNRRGIAEVESNGVTATATNVVYSFPNHAFYNAWYKGLVLVRLNQAVPTGTTGTLPVAFETNGVQQDIVTRGGTPLTVDGLSGEGLYLLYFDRTRNLLQLI